MNDDESLPPYRVLPSISKSADGRSLTPQKIAKMATGTRQISASPLNKSRANSNQRNISASKLRALSEDFQAQDANTGHRSLSQRKRKQFQNNNLHGLYKYLMTSFKDGEEAEFDDVFDLKTLLSRQSNASIDWRSTIGRLYEDQDYDTIEAFRRCDDHISLHHGRKKCVSLPPHLVDYVEAHRAFVGIEKQLRSTVYAAIKKETHLLDFINDLESVLQYYGTYKDIPNQMTYPALQAQLQAPLCIASDTNAIHVHLKDSRLARLMLYMVSKFYRCHCTNVEVGGVKYFVVEQSRRMSSTLPQNVSLVGYLVASLNCEYKKSLSVSKLPSDDGDCVPLNPYVLV